MELKMVVARRELPSRVTRSFRCGKNSGYDIVGVVHVKASKVATEVRRPVTCARSEVVTLRSLHKSAGRLVGSVVRREGSGG